MLVEPAALGAVFLVVAAVCAVAGDPTVAKAGVEASTAAIAGAFGVGSFISLLGGLVWRNWFGYESTDFRERIAPNLQPLHDEAGEIEADPHLRALLTTSLVMYESMPPALLDWIRRRHRGFLSATNTAMALALGLIASGFVTPQLSVARLVVIGSVVVMASIAWRSGRRQRREADAMEQLWFARRKRSQATAD